MKGIEIGSQENKFFRVTRIVVGGFRVIGLAPFSTQNTTKLTLNNYRKNCCTGAFRVSKIGLAYNVLLSILVLVAGAVVTVRWIILHTTDGPLANLVVGVFQQIPSLLTSSVVILCLAFRQKSAVAIMNRLLKIDRLLSGMNKDLMGQRQYFTSLTVQMLVDVVVCLTCSALASASGKLPLERLIIYTTYFIVQWFVLEYSMVLDITARQFESLNKSLTKFEQLPIYLFRPPSTTNYNVPRMVIPTQCGQLAALELFHSIRTTLSEVSQDIADFFSLLILPSIACLLIRVILDCYVLILPLVISIDYFPINENFRNVIRVLSSFIPLVSLSRNVTRTSKEAELTAPIVHKLLATVRRQRIQTELERFSLHLLHENLSFTAYGFFGLDFTLIQSIIGTAATYLIIAIQSGAGQVY